MKTGRSHAHCDTFIIAQPVEVPLAVLCIVLLAILPIPLPVVSSALLSWLRINAPAIYPVLNMRSWKPNIRSKWNSINFISALEVLWLATARRVVYEAR